MKKRFLLSIVMLIFTIIIILPVTKVNAAADTNAIKQKLVDFSKSKYPEEAVFNEKFDGAEQCFGFAKKISYLLFGDIPSWDYKGNPIKNLTQVAQLNKGGYSEVNMRSFISKAQPGDIIQGDVGTNDLQHTMIFCFTNANDTFTVYDANSNGDNVVHIRIIKYSRWSSKTWNHLTILRSTKYPESKAANTVTPAPIPNKQIVEGIYTIESRQGGNLNIYAGKDKDGTNTCIWQKDNSKEQKFRIASLGSNKYKIYVLCSNNGYDRVLDTNRGTSYTSPLKYGLNIDIWKTNDAPAQEWYITNISDDYYKIELVALKDGVMESAGSRNNSNVSLQKYTGSNAQQWKFVK